MLADINFLMQQNVELSNACSSLHSELTYFKLREKKIMYLLYVLQKRGYPAYQVFEQEVKSIPTLRIQEFLDSTPNLEEQMFAEFEDDAKNLFSFRSDDSYERLVDGPQLLRKRPTIVPPLSFEGFPEYETSSDEEMPPEQPQYNGTQPAYY